MDVTTAVAALGLATAAIALIGPAKMLPNAAITSWKWISAAIRGT